MEYSRNARMQLNVCADDMASLRKCDVYRLAENCIKNRCHEEMGKWIEAERSDIITEWQDCCDDIATERVWELQHPEMEEKK